MDSEQVYSLKLLLIFDYILEVGIRALCGMTIPHCFAPHCATCQASFRLHLLKRGMQKQSVVINSYFYYLLIGPTLLKIN